MGLQKQTYSIAEYLEFEEQSEQRHEFNNGEVFAMAGGTFEHSSIAANFLGSLVARLRGTPCRPLTSDMRIRVPKTSRYKYPDATVVCGKPEFDPDDPKRKSLLNPRLIAEVLSDTTESYDRGTKFHDYRRIDSFEEYVLISQDRPSIETFYRQPDGSWNFNFYHGLEAMVVLRSLSLSIPCREIYADIQLPDLAM